MGRGRVTSPRTSRRLWEKCFRAVIVNVPTMLVALLLCISSRSLSVAVLTPLTANILKSKMIYRHFSVAKGEGRRPAICRWGFSSHALAPVDPHHFLGDPRSPHLLGLLGKF